MPKADPLAFLCCKAVDSEEQKGREIAEKVLEGKQS